MMLSRRRFLAVSAAYAGFARGACAETWSGHAFGAEVSIRIDAPRDIAEPALREARALIHRTERLFSLYNPASDLSKLNATGQLTPSADFLALVHEADTIHRATGGLFDPTVQPLWQALAEGRDPSQARALVDWRRVRFDDVQITLGPNQALTFNGIAQGFATDRVTDALAAHGLTNSLVNIGEYRALGGPYRLGLSDPTHGQLGQRTLKTGAIATSSPAATRLNGQGHILHPSAAPLWSTVSVEAETATRADALSTALTLATHDQVERARHIKGVRRITMVDRDGNLSTI